MTLLDKEAVAREFQAALKALPGKKTTLEIAMLSAIIAVKHVTNRASARFVENEARLRSLEQRLADACFRLEQIEKDRT